MLLTGESWAILLKSTFCASGYLQSDTCKAKNFWEQQVTHHPCQAHEGLVKKRRGGE